MNNNLARNYNKERNFTVIKGNGGAKRKNLTESQKLALICKEVNKRYIKPETKAAKKLYRTLIKKLIRRTDIMVNLHIRLFTLISMILMISGAAILVKTSGNTDIVLVIKNIMIATVMILSGISIGIYDVKNKKRKYK